MFPNILIGLGGTIVAAAGAYLMWGPSSPKKTQKGKFPGLENVGNTCFMNALLQAWAACPSVFLWLKQSVGFTEESRKSALLSRTIYKVMKVLNNKEEDSPDVYNPVDVIRALRIRGWVISGEEQDTHELFHVLTETLDEETSRYPSVISLFDVHNLEAPENQYQSEGEAVTRCRGLLPVLPSRSTEQPTRGLLASQLHCLSCGYRCPVKYDTFDSITLPFPRNFWGALSLDSLLKQFVRPEMVQDVECKGCTKMFNLGAVKSNFQKRVSIGKLPQILCLHLSRTQWLENGSCVKRYDHVSFPEMLCMDQYLYSSQPQKGCGDSPIPGLMGGADLMQILSQSKKSSNAAPNSSAVNLLRTLNFDQHITQTGLFVHPQTSPQIPEELSDVNHNAPPDLFKLSPPEFTYKLAAVVCHLGDAQLGHFVTFRRGTHSGEGDMNGGAGLNTKWWLTSDGSVRRVSQDEVLSSEAYMLFYERV